MHQGRYVFIEQRIYVVGIRQALRLQEFWELSYERPSIVVVHSKHMGEGQHKCTSFKCYIYDLNELFLVIQ